MAQNAHVGMNTYNRILQDARSNGEPIGPKHFEYNKQRKAYEARQSNLNQLAGARETKKVKGELRKARVAINQAREKIANKQVELSQGDQEAERLRELHRKLSIQKIADNLKSPRDGSEIKSRGNGL
jgi:soluble cytochrome b562